MPIFESFPQAESYAEIKGRIFFNGVEDSMNLIKPEMAFVPQASEHAKERVRTHTRTQRHLCHSKMPCTLTNLTACKNPHRDFVVVVVAVIVVVVVAAAPTVVVVFVLESLSLLLLVTSTF